jgi:hypothetical protein
MIELAPDYLAGLDREWDRLAASGTWWTGAERVALAATARAAREATPAPDVALPEAARDAAARLAADPHVDQEWIDDLVARGLALEPYVEILAVVSRLIAVDSFLFGVGLPLRPLPGSASHDEPTRQVVADAVLQGAFVPTTGVPFPPTALTAVPPEAEALGDLHTVLYLSMFDMGDQALVRDDLSRMQIELVAARTSLLNDCFY